MSDLFLVHRHEGGHDVDGHWEDDGAVVLRRDTVQGLQVPQLKENVEIQFLKSHILSVKKC